MPRTKADLDPVLDAQVRSLRDQAKEESESRCKGEQCRWMMPEPYGWDGDLFAWQEMEKAFDRSQSNRWFVESISDTENPGTTGDMILCSRQVDYLACMERAFRARHTMRRTRAIAHANGRKHQHGQDRGALSQNVLEYLRGTVSQAKATE